MILSISFKRIPKINEKFDFYFMELVSKDTLLNIFKDNESPNISLFVVSGSIGKLFAIGYVSIYIFSIHCSTDFPRRKNVGLPQIAYIVIH